jgi:hypothetical protein
VIVVPSILRPACQGPQGRRGRCSKMPVTLLYVRVLPEQKFLTFSRSDGPQIFTYISRFGGSRRHPDDLRRRISHSDLKPTSLARCLHTVHRSGHPHFATIKTIAGDQRYRTALKTKKYRMICDTTWWLAASSGAALVESPSWRLIHRSISYIWAIQKCRTWQRVPCPRLRRFDIRRYWSSC